MRVAGSARIRDTGLPALEDKMSKRIMAVDFGASGGTCFVGSFDHNGVEVAEIHRFAHEGTTFFLPDTNGTLRQRTYWDDTLLYAEVLQGLRLFRKGYGADLHSIGFDTWGADGVLMDQHGELLSKVYAYRDQRLNQMSAEVQERISPERIYQITGIHFQPFNLSNQLLWLTSRYPERIESKSVFLPIPSLFYYYLGGCQQVDSTWASVTQLMDARTRTWSQEILQALNIPAGLLPEIVTPGTRVGTMHPELADSLSIAPAPLIAVGSHDTACAFAAAPVKDPNSALIISSGTWSLVGRLVPEPITTAEAQSRGFSNEGGINNTRLLKNCMGSWLVQELRRIWRHQDGVESQWVELDAMTAAAPPFAALLDPDDPGFYNPADMEAAIVTYCERTQQTPPPSRGSMLRTVYESLALKYRWINQQLVTLTATPSTVIHIVGGGCKNQLLNQFVADACNLPVVAGPDEATAAGNLVVQAVGIGVTNSMQAAQSLLLSAFAVSQYQPLNPATWEQAYHRFMAITGLPHHQT